MGVFGLKLPKKTKDVFGAVGHGLNVFDNGQGWTNQAPAPQIDPAEVAQENQMRAMVQASKTADANQRNILAAKLRAAGTSNAPIFDPSNTATNPITMAGQKVINFATGRQAAPVALGIGRSMAGAEEGVGGLYDLLTPGKGINRFTQHGVTQGRSMDEHARGYNQLAYKGGQAVGEVAQLAAAGEATKALTQGLKGAAAAGKVASRAPQLAALGARLASEAPLIEKGGPVLRYLSQPNNLINIGANTLQSAGFRTSRGGDVSLKTTAEDLLTNTLMRGAFNKGGSLIKNIYGQVAPTVAGVAQRTVPRGIEAVNGVAQTAGNTVREMGRKFDNAQAGSVHVGFLAPKDKKPRVTVTTRKPSDSPELWQQQQRGRISNTVDQAPIGSVRRGSDSEGEWDVSRIEKYKKDIREHRAIDPLIIDKNGNIQDGKHRLEAMRQMGMTHVPVVEQKAVKVLSGAAQQSKMSRREGIVDVVKRNLANLDNTESGSVHVGFLSRGEKPPKPPKASPTPDVPDTPEPKKVTVKPAKNGILQQIKRGMSDSDQVILDEMRNLDKKMPRGKGKMSRVDEFMYNSNMQRGSNQVANQELSTSKNISEAIGGLSKKDYEEFSKYANSRTELSTASKGSDGKVRVSRPVEELQATVDAGKEKYGKRFEALNKHYQDLAEQAHKAGLITKETLDQYKSNGDYIRLQRDMGDLLPGHSGKGGGYQLSSTSLTQKRKGSTREALDAGSVMAERTQQIHREIAKNRTGTQLLDNLHEAGLAKQLINSEDVQARRNAFKTMKELKPVRDALAQETKRTTKQLTELVSRNKDLGPKILKKLQSSGNEVRGKAIVLANDGKRTPNRSDSKRLSRAIKESDIHEAFQEYLDGNPKLVRNMYEFIGNKKEAKRVQNTLDGLKAQYESVKAERKDLWLDARSHTDQITKNKNTVSIMRNGIKETYEVSPDMKEAMDNINPYHMNAVMRILAAPGRVLRAGVTGINPVFIARNLVKDQAGSAINSKNMLATHNPRTFFEGLLGATTDAAGMNKNPLYQDFLKHYGDQTSYDQTRNAKSTKEVIDRIRGGRKVAVKQGVRHLLTSAENFASITEKSTRFQNYVGEYRKAVKEGLPHDQASERAAMAAWQNSVDFSRAGTWGRVINTVVPYWNPATQGVRQMGRSLHDRPVKTVLSGAAVVGVPLAAATAWNLSSPDTKEVYDNIPDFEKDNNLILIPPGTKQNKDGSYDIVKIPLPPGYKDSFMPIRRMLESYTNKKPVEGGKIAQDILQTVSGPINTHGWGQFRGSVTPQALKPFDQQNANKDYFTGKQIVPDYMNEATDESGNKIPESKKAYAYTSGTARKIGNATNISPIRVEKFIKDTTGTVGLNALNLADNALATNGSIPKEQIGGQSVAGGMKRSFGSSQGIENFQKSEGAKYFDEQKAATKNLNTNEKSAYEALHPSKKNFLGDKIYENDAVYDPAARLDIYNRFPKVYEADKALDRKNREKGKPGNPMYDLENWQLKKVLEKENLPAGAKDPELDKLFEKDWFVDYKAKKTSFFDKLKTQAKKEGREFGTNDNPYPDTPPNVQKALDTYSSLPKGTGQRSGWIKSNPGLWQSMQQQFAKVDNWQNIARGKRGLDATEGEVGKAAGYGDQSGFGGSSGPKYASYYKKYSSGGNVTKGGTGKAPTVKVKAKPRKRTSGKVTVRSSKIRMA